MKCVLLTLSLLAVNKILISQKLSAFRGTTVLVYLSKDSFIIAADSKQTSGNDSSRKFTNCLKIGHRNGIFYAFAGSARVGEVSKEKQMFFFDASKDIDYCIRKYQGFDTICSEYKKIITNQMNSVRMSQGSNFIPFEIGQRMMEVAVIAFENDTLKYKFIDFGFVMKDRQISFEPFELDQKNDTYPAIHFMGITDHIVTLQPTWSSNMAEELRRLIEIEDIEHEEVEVSRLT